ncbi:MAG: hypothetical protein GKS01_00720 [Alphaproteobacteria bacterium]|nr:hypothetical protein [Alphaproteobacteria bacterium]
MQDIKDKVELIADSDAGIVEWQIQTVASAADETNGDSCGCSCGCGE